MIAAATAPTSPDDVAVREVARYLVDSGRVIPGLAVDDEGRGRACWWPLPAATDRELVAGLLAGSSEEAHLGAARALAGAVDDLMRARLEAARVSLTERRPGRRTVPEAWLHALTAPDPRLSASLDPARVAELAETVAAWARSGAALLGRTRPMVRVHEPAGERWLVEVLMQDVDEPSLVVPVGDLLRDPSLLRAEKLEEALASLGHLTRVAPELAPLLDDESLSGVTLDAAAFVRFASDRVAPLTEIGVAVLLPSAWTDRATVGLRAKVDGGTARAVVAGGIGMNELLTFTWEAALGERRLTRADLNALERAAAAKQPLVRVRGRWVEVDPAAIDALLRHVGVEGAATAAELLRAGLGLPDASLAPGAPVVGVAATGWLGALLDDALHARITPVATPSSFVGGLRPYQERGVGWLCFLGRLGLGACLADDMGLGKTAQLIAAILADPTEGPTLVVSPVSVLGNWSREITRFAPHLRVMIHHGADRHRAFDQAFAERAAAHDVVLTTYALVTRDIDILTTARWGRLALDEAQQVKNPATAQARAVARIRADRRIALTGTPVENRLTDLWSLMQILNPGLLGGATAFRERFAVPIERDHDATATALLRRVTGPFVLRRLKTDRSIIADLPDKIEQTERCVLTREQATLYQAVVNELLASADETSGIERRGLVLAGLMKLKQVCNHPAHFLRDGSALPGRSGKLERVEELLDEIVAAGDRVLCFTQFTEWGTLLVSHLARRYGRDPLWLHGGVSRARRDELVATFGAADGPPIFLLSLKAGGTGLNLTAASHVIHLDRWWNPAVEDQATDRAYRIGQRRTVLVHKLVSTGSVEERIDEMIARKRSVAERVVGAGEEWITRLTTDELREVIALRANGGIA